ncbi:uncharacterized protein TRUGW13939_05607 [Talaromyces rugulosus]|uniref:Ribosomal protein S19/S15 n=1 Tax=Talaromyces rugulosus TaxID=121627 RepID=A0A7H8R0R9_TALRU|nr:uncharacterized protein TRUGW13939_05607 [Talaromyces rugulosus]QKX58483.1 hypothetical protein TRUGW13939_05607 [Talaromyces rugulosus]
MFTSSPSQRTADPAIFQIQHNVSYEVPVGALSVESLPLPRTLPPPPGTPPIRTQARSATILPNFVGLRFAVHNGKIYQDVIITEEMVGRKLGEFVGTRKRFTYKQSKNK